MTSLCFLQKRKRNIYYPFYHLFISTAHSTLCTCSWWITFPEGYPFSHSLLKASRPLHYHAILPVPFIVTLVKWAVCSYFFLLFPLPFSQLISIWLLFSPLQWSWSLSGSQKPASGWIQRTILILQLTGPLTSLWPSLSFTPSWNTFFIWYLGWHILLSFLPILWLFVFCTLPFGIHAVISSILKQNKNLPWFYFLHFSASLRSKIP